MRTVFGWDIPDNPEFEFELTPEQERECIIRSLTGPWPGPNQRAIAEILADRLIAIRDEENARQKAEQAVNARCPKPPGRPVK